METVVYDVYIASEILKTEMGGSFGETQPLQRFA